VACVARPTTPGTGHSTIVSRMWWYTLCTVIVWVINPELRRVFDWRFGNPAVDLFPLLPFVSVMPHVWSLTYGAGWQRLSRPLLIATWLWLGGFGYAFIIAVANGNLLPGAYSFANFVLPSAVGLWIAADRTPFVMAYGRITRLLFVLTTIISAYGIVQYAVAPEWDALWLRQAILEGANSFGSPEPFQIRVFSMLASPQPFGTFMALMLLLALPQLSLKRPLLLIQLPIWLIAFGLSLDRSGWLMFAFGLLIYIVLTPRRGMLLVTASISTAMVLGLVVALPEVIGNDAVLTSLSNRMASLSDLDRDRSENDRRQLYASSMAMMSEAPLGEGLGVFGTATKLSSPPTESYIDSGFIARFVEMGVPGAALFLATLAVLATALFRTWQQARRSSDILLQGIAGIALTSLSSLFWLQLSGEVSGLPMFTLWLICGIALGVKVAIVRPEQAQLHSAGISQAHESPSRNASWQDTVTTTASAS
jgi:putative inorganic carbon (HCO3(-)) transporter